MKQRYTSNLSDEKKRFAKLLEQIDCSRSHKDLFRDFCEMSALTLQLPFDRTVIKTLKPLMEKYKPEQLAIFDQMLSIMVDSLENRYHDFLGDVFMSLDMGNEHAGQFFTPYPICELMAQLSFTENAVEALIKDKGYFTCNDPAAGAGACLIASIDHLKAVKLDYSNCVYMVAQDIDYLACCMSFIQLSLCGVAATVINCDSLWPQERTWHTWNTPVYYLNNWGIKIELRRIREIEKRAVETVPAMIEQPAQVLPVSDQQPKSQLVFDFTVPELEAV